MSTTDHLNLNATEMFAKLRASLPTELQYSQNLLECKDDLLFAWEPVDCCLLVINWREAHLKGHETIKYQTLIPSFPHTFQVERVLCSEEGTLVALAGPRGVSMLELPRRYGRNYQFMDGKEKIICQAHILDAKFFNNNQHLEVRQLHWHPASPTDSHLLVLLSDNTIRVYDNANLRRVWQVGPLPHNVDGAKNSTMPSILDLGEISVDFDFAPAVKTINNSFSASNANQSSSALQRTTSEKIEWPIVLLRENGNVYVLMAGLDTERPRLQGPLCISPQTVDNFGLDSCAILAIHSLPTTLIIAQSNGRLHHALLLEAESAEQSFNEVDSTLIIHPYEWTVHVLETVELELGLPKEDANCSRYTCPIFLKRDFINELRYFAYHNAGLHVITINFIAELQRYLESEVHSDFTSLAVPSRAEYLICTKVSDNSERINAVLGFVLLQLPSGIVLFLGSGQVISLKLLIDAKLLNSSVRSDSEQVQNDGLHVASELDKLLEGPLFSEHIKSLLHRNVSQPLLCIGKSASLSSLEGFELLTQAIEVLRTQYLKRHDVVRAHFAKHVKLINLYKEEQRKSLQNLESELKQIRERAHQLADKFDETSERQEMLTRQCQDLVRQANSCIPSNNIADEEYAQEVLRIAKQTTNLQLALKKAKDIINRQNYQISKFKDNPNQKSIELPEKQERAIQEILMELTIEIDSQMKEVKRINKVLEL